MLLRGKSTKFRTGHFQQLCNKLPECTFIHATRVIDLHHRCRPRLSSYTKRSATFRTLTIEADEHNCDIPTLLLIDDIHFFPIYKTGDTPPAVLNFVGKTWDFKPVDGMCLFPYLVAHPSQNVGYNPQPIIGFNLPYLQLGLQATCPA